MKLLLNQKYYNIYLVAAIIAVCFLFMVISTVVVLKNIGGGKTSADIALEKAQQNCNRKKGELVQLSKQNPLNTVCIAQR
ncbi:MAG: hypothetical protein PHI47_11550 [Sulfuricurvum sp.]|uniref:hypothetical protein n=1 Tax=Sulfuricurvum sp. TaxID=2025608 RepID=UPI0026130875|nr:hypothetical protein [Sulfuricurvum sp.]MDD5160680.1 hypothetical protein [Sulfuricurvum sp.]